VNGSDIAIQRQKIGFLQYSRADPALAVIQVDFQLQQPTRHTLPSWRATPAEHVFAQNQTRLLQRIRCGLKFGADCAE
jgi:hypothetical protein